MRMPGYCTGCHRIKQVNVTGNGLVLALGRRTPTGICADCEHKQDEERKARR